MFHRNPDVRPAPKDSRCQYYPQCQLRSAVNLLLMHSDRSPTVRTPVCLLIGQPDGQLNSRRGPDISVSNQISPSKSLFMCVCLWVRGRECTVPSDRWERMCWRRPECVLKWRLMKERPECGWADKTEGSVDVFQRVHKLELQFTYCGVCVCMCVWLYCFF